MGRLPTPTHARMAFVQHRDPAKRRASSTRRDGLQRLFTGAPGQYGGAWRQTATGRALAEAIAHGARCAAFLRANASWDKKSIHEQ